MEFRRGVLVFSVMSLVAGLAWVLGTPSTACAEKVMRFTNTTDSQVTIVVVNEDLSYLGRRLLAAEGQSSTGSRTEVRWEAFAGRYTLLVSVAGRRLPDIKFTFGPLDGYFESRSIVEDGNGGYSITEPASSTLDQLGDGLIEPLAVNGYGDSTNGTGQLPTAPCCAQKCQPAHRTHIRGFLRCRPR